MKRIIIALTIMLWHYSVVSQSNQKNEFRIECFSPVMTPSMKQYFNDDWLLTPSNNYSRKYNSIGFAASYSRKIKELKLGYRFGLVTRSVKESNEYDYYSGNTYYVKEDFNYSQKQFFNSVFLSHEEQINRISIHFTLELPFIIYGVGNNDYYNRTYSNDPTTGDLGTDYIINENSKVSSGIATGLGLNIGLAYSITTKMSIGLELTDYLLYTTFTQPTEIEHSEYTYYFDPFSSTTQITNESVLYDQSNKYSQFGFSRLSPRLFYSIKF